jgi:hypothetical protein
MTKKKFMFALAATVAIKTMKNLFCVLAATALLCGCSGMFEANNRAVAQLSQQMSPEWLKANIVIGKTTPQEVLGFFGKPMLKNASSGTGMVAAFMPDEMWTYSVRFSSTASPDRETKTIVFSFKNGTVSNYNVSSMSF